MLSTTNVLFKSGYVSDAIVALTVFMEVCSLYDCTMYVPSVFMLQLSPDSVIGHFTFGNVLAVKVSVSVCLCLCMSVCVCLCLCLLCVGMGQY